MIFFAKSQLASVIDSMLARRYTEKMAVEKQLSVRSSEAAALASELARKLDRSQKEVVLEGLRLLEEKTEASDPRQRGKADPSWRRFEETLRRFQDEVQRIERETGEKLTSNHDDMYDEFGLPK